MILRLSLSMFSSCHKLNPTPANDSEKARVVLIMLADQLVKAVSTFGGPVAVGLNDEASGGCVDPGSENSGRMRRMKERESKQDREQKLHPVQCSATILRLPGIGSVDKRNEPAAIPSN